MFGVFKAKIRQNFGFRVKNGQNSSKFWFKGKKIVKIMILR